MTINAEFDGPVPTDGQIAFRFVDTAGTSLAGHSVIVPGEEGLVVAVPDGAVSITIGPETAMIPDGGDVVDVVDVTIMTAPSLGGDLLWALGASRAFSVKDVAVTFPDG